MRTKLLVCIAVLLCVFFNSVKAQTDSSNYDLGRIILQKKFTQAVTIKAADLEKMPFTSLKDAINVYINGAYSSKQTYAFVIDGNLNTDVNAYSIYDIDEITFIQNATTVLNGVNAAQTLILIKTKRAGTERSGIMVAGQTNLVRLYNSYAEPSSSRLYNSGHSTTNLYHQYYLSGYVNLKNISAGASADIQHNVFPRLFNKDIFSGFNPLNSNRFRFNGYFDVKIGNHNSLSINAGYVPERDIQYELTELNPPNGHHISSSYNIYSSQNLAYTDIKFNSIIAEGLTNKFSAGFQHLQFDAHRNDLTLDNNALTIRLDIDTAASINNYLVKDDISYQEKLGGFTIQPNLNFTYRQAKNINSFTVVSRYGNGTNIKFHPEHQIWQKLGILTPSIAINYADIAMLQGGFQTLVNSDAKVVNGNDFTVPLPFASLSVNALSPFGIDSTDAHLMLFGSYVKNFLYSTDLYGSLLDFDFIRFNNNKNATYTIDPYQTYTQLQAGITLSLLNNNLSFNYNYTIKRFNTTQITIVTDPLSVDIYSLTDARIDMHRFGVDFNLPGEGSFSWRSSLNGTLVILRDNYKIANLIPEVFHLIYPGKPLVTGGFINHLGYKNLFLDVSLLYCFNQAQTTHPLYANTFMATGKTNVFDIQNLDVGYKIPTSRFKYLEVFANARNLLEKGHQEASANQFIVDDRRFYGAGFKVGL